MKKLSTAQMRDFLAGGATKPSKPRTALDLMADKRSLLSRVERLQELISTKELLAAKHPRGHQMDLESYRDDLLDVMKEVSEVELALLKATEETSAIDPKRTLVSAAPALDATPAERDFIDVQASEAPLKTMDEVLDNIDEVRRDGDDSV